MYVQESVHEILELKGTGYLSCTAGFLY